MRYTQPTQPEILRYTALRVEGCSDIVIGFNFLKNEPTVSRRRYCNKILVHECVPLDVADPMQLNRVDFMATDDPCYRFFNIFKSSDAINDTDPTIEIQYDGDNLAIGILVRFTARETAGVPLRMAFRMRGYDDSDIPILLSHGTLYITPCSCDGIPSPIYDDAGNPVLDDDGNPVYEDPEVVYEDGYFTGVDW